MNKSLSPAFRKFSHKLNNAADWKWLCGVIITLIVLLYQLFWKVLKHPGNYVMGMWGDAIKNHFTTLYYIQYDRGSWFTGMNYPYGEQITFPDTQPLLAFILGFVKRNIYELSAYQSLALLNGFMLLSMALAGGVLFLILRRSLLPPLYAAVTAGLIVFLSPQHFRLTGHYGLAYTFIIPTLWYIIIRIFENRRQWGWYIAYVAFALAGGLLHAYFILMAAIFLLAYAFTYALQNIRRFRKDAWFLAALFLTAVLPAILFQSWLFLTDPVTDRAKEQYGFFVYVSNFNSIFSPWISPYKETWQTIFHNSEPIEEGKAYVGIIGFVCLILTTLKALGYLFRLKIKPIFKPVLPQPLRVSIWAAVLAALYAMAYPFKLEHGFEKLLELFPQLKQFRSLGRFAWIFYYVFSVYTAFYFYQLYRYLSLKQARKFGITFLAIMLSLWYVDAKINLGREIIKTREFEQGRNFTDPDNNYKAYLASVNTTPAAFQAIIPLPYFSIGSQKVSLDRQESVFETFRASLNTGLPVAATMMSRTSNRQTLDLVQLFSNDLIEKKLPGELPSRKPFLLIVAQNVTLEPHEQHLVDKSVKVFENERVKLYSLSLNRFASTRLQQLQEFRNKKAGMKEQNGIYTEGKTASIVYQDFDQQEEIDGFLGKGALWKPDFGNLILFEASLPAADTALYEASFWVSTQTSAEMPLLLYKQIAPDGTVVEEKAQTLGQTIDNFHYWVRAALTFRLTHPQNKIVLTLEGKEIKADCLLIKPLQQDVYVTRRQNHSILFNNYPIAF